MSDNIDDLANLQHPLAEPHASVLWRPPAGFQLAIAAVGLLSIVGALFLRSLPGDNTDLFNALATSILALVGIYPTVVAVLLINRPVGYLDRGALLARGWMGIFLLGLAVLWLASGALSLGGMQDTGRTFDTVAFLTALLVLLLTPVSFAGFVFRLSPRESTRLMVARAGHLAAREPERAVELVKNLRDVALKENAAGDRLACEARLDGLTAIAHAGATAAGANSSFVAGVAMDEISFIAETLVDDRDVSAFAIGQLDALASLVKGEVGSRHEELTASIHREAIGILATALAQARPSDRLVSSAADLVRRTSNGSPPGIVATRLVPAASCDTPRLDYWLRFVLDLYRKFSPPPSAVDPFLDASTDPIDGALLRLTVFERVRFKRSERVHEYEHELASDLAQAMAGARGRERIRRRLRGLSSGELSLLGDTAIAMIEGGEILAIELMREALRQRNWEAWETVTGSRGLRSRTRVPRLVPGFGPRYLTEFPALLGALTGDLQGDSSLDMASDLLGLVFILHGQRLRGGAGLEATTTCLVLASQQSTVPEADWRRRLDDLCPALRMRESGRGLAADLLTIAMQFGANDYLATAWSLMDWRQVIDPSEVVSAIAQLDKLSREVATPNDTLNLDEDLRDMMLGRLRELVDEAAVDATLSTLRQFLFTMDSVNGESVGQIFLDARGTTSALRDGLEFPLWAGLLSRGLVRPPRSAGLAAAAAEPDCWEWLVNEALDLITSARSAATELGVPLERDWLEPWIVCLILGGVSDERSTAAAEALTTCIARDIVTMDEVGVAVSRSLNDHRSRPEHRDAAVALAEKVCPSQLLPSHIVASVGLTDVRRCELLAALAFETAQEWGAHGAPALGHDIAGIPASVLRTCSPSVCHGLAVLIFVTSPLLPQEKRPLVSELAELRDRLPSVDLGTQLARLSEAGQSDDFVTAAMQTLAVLFRPGTPPSRLPERLWRAIAHKDAAKSKALGRPLSVALRLVPPGSLGVPPVLAAALEHGLTRTNDEPRLHLNVASWRWLTEDASQLVRSWDNVASRTPLARLAKAVLVNSLFEGMHAMSSAEAIACLAELSGADDLLLARTASLTSNWDPDSVSSILESLAEENHFGALLGLTVPLSSDPVHYAGLAFAATTIGRQVEDRESAREVLRLLAAIWSWRVAKTAVPKSRALVATLVERCLQEIRRSGRPLPAAEQERVQELRKMMSSRRRA